MLQGRTGTILTEGRHAVRGFRIARFAVGGFAAMLEWRARAVSWSNQQSHRESNSSSSVELIEDESVPGYCRNVYRYPRDGYTS